MKRRHFFTFSCLSALSVATAHATSSEPRTLDSWKTRYLSSGDVLRITPDKLIDQVEKLGRISGNPVRAEGSHLFVRQNEQEHKIQVALFL